jgi:hypothetical protein
MIKININHISLFLFNVVLEFGFGALHVLGKCYTTQATLPTLLCFLDIFQVLNCFLLRAVLSLPSSYP